MKEVKQKIKKHEISFLVALNAVLIYLLLIFDKIGVLPLSWFYFMALLIILIIVAFRRLEWFFLIFIGLIPMEIVNLAPSNLGFNLRAYQFIGLILAVSLVLRFLINKDLPSFPRLRKLDYLVILFLFLNLIATFFSYNYALSFKLWAVLASFAYLYFLTRYFSQNFVAIKQMLPMFFSSLVVIIFYGFLQNILFLKGVDGGEVMPGRPNATFAEADWLGMYLVFAVSIIYSIIFYLISDEGQKKQQQIYKLVASNIALIFTIAILIITVSRSAWLGFFSVSFFFLWVVLTNFKVKLKYWHWSSFSRLFLIVVTCVAASFVLVQIFNVTNFELFNRARSTSTGLQKITISCKEEIKLRNELEKGIEFFSLQQLEAIDCHHINLEDIETERGLNRYIAEVNRKDPNVEIRKMIYVKSFEQLSEHPIMGIGMGSISEILGKDERGAGFNASNVFLEIWLGGGILGLAVFGLILIFICFKAFHSWIEANSEAQKAFSLFIFLGLIAIIIPNLFNAGIFIGFLWVFLALVNCD